MTSDSLIDKVSKTFLLCVGGSHSFDLHWSTVLSRLFQINSSPFATKVEAPWRWAPEGGLVTEPSVPHAVPDTGLNSRGVCSMSKWLGRLVLTSITWSLHHCSRCKDSIAQRTASILRKYRCGVRNVVKVFFLWLDDLYVAALVLMPLYYFYFAFSVFVLRIDNVVQYSSKPGLFRWMSFKESNSFTGLSFSFVYFF